MSGQGLLQWVQNSFRPAVLVVSTPKAEAACQKNELSCAELLRPLGLKPEKISALSFRATNRSVGLSNFGVRFVSRDDFVQPSSGDIDTYLHYVTSQQAENARKDDGIRDITGVKFFFQLNRDPTPWFTAYREASIDLLRSSPYDYLDQPLICVITVSSEDENILELVNSLKDKQNMPWQCQAGVYETNLTFAYLILHDHAAGDDVYARATLTLDELKQRYRHNSCELVQINTATTETAFKKDIWTPTLRRIQDVVSSLHSPPPPSTPPPRSASVVLSQPPSAASHVRRESLQARISQDDSKSSSRGSFLSRDDVDNLSSFVAKVVMELLLPQLEKRVASLSQIAHKRKSISATFSRFFGKGHQKTFKPVPGHKQTYEFNSPEAQIRMLADLAFMMQDYDYALQTYRLVVHDYKTDKNLLHYAGCLEMMGLCLALTDGSRKEMYQCFEEARSLYHGHKDAERALKTDLWLVDWFKTVPGMTRDAPRYLTKASDKVAGVRSALLVEQAAYMYLSVKPTPMIRKYAFHLIMAGHQYSKCKEIKAAVRCFRTAVNIFVDRQWFHVEDHINLNLGKKLFEIEDFEGAISFFVDLVAGGKEGTEKLRQAVKQRQSADRQSLFLREFLFVVKQWAGGHHTGPKEVPNLRVPLLDDEGVVVSFADEKEFADPTTLTLPCEYTSSVWTKALYETPSISKFSRNILSLEQSFVKESHRCAHLGERICVTFEVYNPLHISICMKDVKLRCRFDPENEAVDNAESFLDITKQDVDVGPNKCQTIQLRVACRTEGTLHIEGVTWIVFETVKALHQFKLPPRRVFSKNMQLIKEVQDTRLEIPMKCHMPYLELSFLKEHPAPTNLYQGECHQSILCLRNTGQIGLCDMQMKLTHPAFTLVTARSQDANDPPTTYHCELKDGTIDLSSLRLGPQEQIELCVWFRGVCVGDHNVGFLIKYKRDEHSTPPASSSSCHCLAGYRVSCFQQTLSVSSLIGISSFVKPSLSQVERNVLAVAMINSSVAADASIDSVFLGSKDWTFTSPRPHNALDSKESTVMCPKESYSAFIYAEEDQKASDMTWTAFHADGYTLQQVAQTPSLQEVVKASHPGGAVASLLALEKALRRYSKRVPDTPEPTYHQYIDMGASWTYVPKSLPPLPGQSSAFHPPLRSGVVFLPDQDLMVRRSTGGCPLKVLLDFQSVLEHNFTPSQPYVELPVTIHIHNSLDDQHVSLTFETLPPEEEFDPSERRFRQIKNSSLTARYFWHGITVRKINDLPPKATTKLTLCAVFHSEGMYNLNRFKFLVTVPTKSNPKPKKPRVFYFPLQHLASVIPSPENQSVSSLSSGQIGGSVSSLSGSSIERKLDLDLDSFTSLEQVVSEDEDDAGQQDPVAPAEEVKDVVYQEEADFLLQNTPVKVNTSPSGEYDTPAREDPADFQVSLTQFTEETPPVARHVRATTRNLQSTSYASSDVESDDPSSTDDKKQGSLIVSQNSVQIGPTETINVEDRDLSFAESENATDVLASLPSTVPGFSPLHSPKAGSESGKSSKSSPREDNPQRQT